MLKDKYKFKFSQGEAQDLQQKLNKMFFEAAQEKDLQIMLPVSVLAEFHKRLTGALLFPKTEIKIHLKRTEAIAFMFLYLTNYIEQTLETAQIAHAIDTTL